MELRPYQIEHLAKYMALKRIGNLSDPGTGKTPPTCVFMGWLWREKGVRTIWTMPKSLMKKNRTELLHWAQFAEEDVVIIDGTPAKRLKQMQSDAKVFIMTFTGFADNCAKLVELHPDIDCFIGDEWHLGFKSDDSKRTQMLYNFMERTTWMVAMTGTLIDGRLDSAYPFIQLVEPKAYPGGYYSFRAHHGIENDFGQIVAWRDADEVAKILERHTVRVSFEQAYGPEAKIIEHELCEMDPKQFEAYQEFEETALLELENDWLSGEMPGVAQIRCRQLMEHPQEFGPPLDKIKYTGKEERLMVHLQSRTGPLIIFGAFQRQHERVHEICKSLKIRSAIINGSVSSKRRFEIDEQFRNGDLDVVIASAATAGVGFNWGHVDHILFLSLDPMDSNFVQGYRRAIRGQRERPLLITVFKYLNSRVEDRIFQIVDEKSHLAHQVDATRERLRLKPKKSREAVAPTTFNMSDYISGNQ